MKEEKILISVENLEELLGMPAMLEEIKAMIEGLKMDSVMEIDNLYTNADVQRILKVSSSTLQSLRSSGRIDFLKRGRKVYYTKKHINDFLTDSETE